LYLTIYKTLFSAVTIQKRSQFERSWSWVTRTMRTDLQRGWWSRLLTGKSIP